MKLVQIIKLRLILEISIIFTLKKELENGLCKMIIPLTNNLTIGWTKEELENLIENRPDCFSPNVIQRPLYQEVLLPNLCYIGGGGELAYWLQLKSMFEASKVTFPMLLLRNSAFVISDKSTRKLERMNLTVNDLFLTSNNLIKKQIKQISAIAIDFSPQKKFLEEQFKSLYELAHKTDKSFMGAVKAQEVKQKKGLDNLEKDCLRHKKEN